MSNDAPTDAERVAEDGRLRSERVGPLRTLCAGLAHEFRNPLNAAKLQLELAQRRLRRVSEDPKLVEPIELAHHELDRLTALLDEFLAFAQPASLVLREQDILAVVREVIELERPGALRRGVELALVSPPVPMMADVDSSKLRQILENLVVNALEAVSAGGHVTVDVGPVDGRVHIRVTDDGPGIPAAVLSRIYDPFFSTKEAGTGMGMSIVHSLVALHHGTIDVRSSPRGTTFDVAMPRRIAGMP